MYRRSFCVLLSACAVVVAFAVSDKEPAKTGPATEKRFPPLKVPEGFNATLYACDPLIEYPSVIALGPKQGELFVAADFVTGLGIEIVRRDEIRLIADTDGDGYADKSVVYADKFNSIQGLAYHDGTVFVMHAPLLTALRDTNGDGKADERKDLLDGLGLSPEKNQTRLHCANGVVVGHDGWLYLAMGDHGCDVTRPEKDRFTLRGGGILRCRPDGRDLHLFAGGLRNIYDVALDEELNVFVRDNENDGGTYMIRVCHSFFGADHGYPYLYTDRPDEALAPLADLGRGSSAGGVCYLETQFPAEYRGSLFFCEWGRSVVRYKPVRGGSGFVPLKEEMEFATGDATDPYGFKPTDLVVDRDGSLLIADWADGQRPTRGRGRIYRVTANNVKKIPPRRVPATDDVAGWIARLDSESSYERVEAQQAIERLGAKGMKAVLEAIAKGKIDVRGRLHAVWIIAHVGGSDAATQLFDLAQSEREPRVQAQAIRAWIDLVDPVLTRHRLDAGAGDTKLAQRLASWAEDKDPRVLLEVVIALGRLRWADTPDWLAKTLKKPDVNLAHAAMQAMRRSGNWKAILSFLDKSDSDPLRAIALRSLAEEYVGEVVDGLIARFAKDRQGLHRRQDADLLARVYKKPGTTEYWGYRPAPRPANSEEWDRTKEIARALNNTLEYSCDADRLVVLRAMQREKVPVEPTPLGRWLKDEDNEERLTVILESMREHPAADTRDLLKTIVGEPKKPATARVTALTMFASGLDEANEKRLLDLAKSLEDGPVLAEALRQLGKHPRLKSSTLLVTKLESTDARVRAGAVDALASLRATDAGESVRKLLDDKDVAVRRAATAAMGTLEVRSSAPTLLKLVTDKDGGVRLSSLESLRLLKEPRALPLAVVALADTDTRRPALQLIGELGGPEQLNAVVDVARRDPSAEVLALVLRMLTKWREKQGAKVEELDRAAGELQGISGVLARWQVSGPIAADAVSKQVESLTKSPETPKEPRWETVFPVGTDARVRLIPAKATAGTWLAYAEVYVAERTDVEFLSAGTTGLRVWLNGKLLHKRDEARPFRADSERFAAVLDKGSNRVIVALPAAEAGTEFHLRFRRKSSTVEHEKLTQAALTRTGNAENGRKLFLDANKTQCVKCHRVGEQGERIGPELTDIGTRFSRIHLIEAILQPSRAVAPGFQAVAITLKNGKVFTGVKVAETDTTLTLADNKGEKQVLRKADVDDTQLQTASVMPEGLEKPLTTEEFVDLITFLVSLKDVRQR